MTNVARDERSAAAKDPEGSQLLARIGCQVLQVLGEPPGFRAVNVRRLWEDHYRVNVFVGGDAMSATIKHSFFLKADGTGHVLTATPKLMRRY
jgi:hypothetical protein